MPFVNLSLILFEVIYHSIWAYRPFHISFIYLTEFFYIGPFYFAPLSVLPLGLAIFITLCGPIGPFIQAFRVIYIGPGALGLAILTTGIRPVGPLI